MIGGSTWTAPRRSRSTVSTIRLPPRRQRLVPLPEAAAVVVELHQAAAAVAVLEPATEHRLPAAVAVEPEPAMALPAEAEHPEVHTLLENLTDDANA